MSGWGEAALWDVLQQLKCPNFQVLGYWPHESTQTPCACLTAEPERPPFRSPRPSYEDPCSEDYLPGCHDDW
ncbi:hypothetical protein QFZ68_007538 [Streptomyces sp. V1I6]|nr:hypothetical protein [Streptomyces sp. V1I6]